MKNPKLLTVMLFINLMIVISTTGCWNRRELPSLGIVMGMGVDKKEEKAEVTVQLVKTSELKSGGSSEGSSSGGGGNSSAYWNVQNTGDSMFSIIRDFTHKTSRKLYWPHNQVIIFGRSLAEKGVQEYLDFFIRDQETRLGVSVLVAQDKASNILDFQSKLEKIPAVGISDLMEAQTANSQTMDIKLNQFVTRLLSPTTEPIAPIIKTIGNGSSRELSVEGTAIFKKDKLVGELNKVETRGLLWIIDKIKSGIINVKCPDCGSTVSLEIIRSKSKISAKIIEDKPVVIIDIKEDGNIGSQACPANLVSPDAVAELEKQKSQAIIDEVKTALKKAQKLNADIFGFGELFHKKYPKEWQTMKEDWDEIFPSLEVEIVVEAKIRRSGTLGRPALQEKEQ